MAKTKTLLLKGLFFQKTEFKSASPNTNQYHIILQKLKRVQPKRDKRSSLQWGERHSHSLCCQKEEPHQPHVAAPCWKYYHLSFNKQITHSPTARQPNKLQTTEKPKIKKKFLESRWDEKYLLFSFLSLSLRSCSSSSFFCFSCTVLIGPSSDTGHSRDTD